MLNGEISLSFMNKVYVAYQVAESLIKVAQMCVWLQKLYTTGDVRMVEMPDPDAEPLYHR